jgi:TetR/AcrR family transcriptional repressor of nem operon
MNESKEHILRTSLKLFLQKSFKEVTMKEIVNQAGLSKGAFYHYFSSKEQVFAEVIQYFFMDMMMTDYTKIPQRSLKEFYQGLLDRLEKNRSASEKLFTEQQENGFSTNYYYLIFDAMRMLPDFKKSNREELKRERTAWTALIGSARENKEIQTHLTDEQVASLFIYLGDGVNINRIMEERPQQRNKELVQAWDNLYSMLKVPVKP